MLKQASFLEPGWKPIVPADPNLIPAERKRLGPKCRAILDRLREGPASGSELVRITHRFSARIWDLREAGCSISTRADRETGWSLFTLEYEPAGLA